MIRGHLSKKIILLATFLVIIAAVVFFARRSSLPEYRISISPEEMILNVTPAQARANLCNKMSGGLYDVICDKDFDNVAKNDDEKLYQLFALMKDVEQDDSLSDYDRYYLSQLIFFSLPTGDSPMKTSLGMSEAISRLLKRLVVVPVVFAQNRGTSANMRNFDEQVARDLVSIYYDLPKGDNAWVINIMVSKYAWVDGVRRPIYSEQYNEVFDPFPNALDESQSTLDQLRSLRQNQADTSHLRSFVSSISVGIDERRPNVHEGTSVMMAYSFTIESWYSPGAGHDESASEINLKSRRNFSEAGYNDNNEMDELMAILTRVEENPSSNKVTKRRKAALDSRKNYKPSVKVQTRPGTYELPDLKDAISPTETPQPTERSVSELDYQECLTAADATGKGCQSAQWSCLDGCDRYDAGFYECENVCIAKSKTCYQARNDVFDACKEKVCLEAGGKFSEGFCYR